MLTAIRAYARKREYLAVEDVINMTDALANTRETRTTHPEHHIITVHTWDRMTPQAGADAEARAPRTPDDQNIAMVAMAVRAVPPSAALQQVHKRALAAVAKAQQRVQSQFNRDIKDSGVKNAWVTDLHNVNGLPTWWKRIIATPVTDTREAVPTVKLFTEAKVTSKTKGPMMSTLETEMQRQATTRQSHAWDKGATMAATTHEWDIVRHGVAGLISTEWLEINARAWCWRECMSSAHDDALPLKDGNGDIIKGDISGRFDAGATTGGRVLELTVWGWRTQTWEARQHTPDAPARGDVSLPNMRILLVYNMYTGSTAAGVPCPTGAHTKPGVQMSFDRAIIIYCARQDAGTWFMLSGDLNRCTDPRLSAWTIGRENMDMQTWLATLEDVAGMRPNERQAMHELLATGLTDAATAMHKHVALGLGTGGWFPQLHAFLLLRLDYMLMNKRALSTLIAEATYSIDVARHLPHPAQARALTEECQQSDHAPRMIACAPPGDRETRSDNAILNRPVGAGNLMIQGWCTRPGEDTEMYSTSQAAQAHIVEALVTSMAYVIAANVGKLALGRTTTRIAWQAICKCRSVNYATYRCLTAVAVMACDDTGMAIGTLRQQVMVMREIAEAVYVQEPEIVDHLRWPTIQSFAAEATAVVQDATEYMVSPMDVYRPHGRTRVYAQHADETVDVSMATPANSNAATAGECAYTINKTPARMVRPMANTIEPEHAQADTMCAAAGIKLKYRTTIRTPTSMMLAQARAQEARAELARALGIQDAQCEISAVLAMPTGARRGTLNGCTYDAPCVACCKARVRLTQHRAKQELLISQLAARVS